MQRNRLLSITSLFLSVLIVFCQSRCASRKQDKDQIAIVLKDSTVYEFLSREKASFYFLNEDLIKDKIEFSPDTMFTIISIKVDSDWTGLVYKENGQSKYSYVFQNGDSILLNLYDKKPWMEVSNRPTKKFDSNWELLRNQEIFKKEPTYLKEFYSLWDASSNPLVPIDLGAELGLYKDSAIEELKREREVIDSLADHGLMTNSIATNYLKKNQFEREKIDFFEVDRDSFDAYNAAKFFLNNNDFDKASIYLDEYSDFLLNQLIDEYPNKIERILGKTSDHYFSQLMAYKLLKRKVEVLSFAEVDQLITNEGFNLPSNWTKTIVTHFNELKNLESDMELKGLEEKKLSFKDLLAEKKGDYLYVDLWAAWCLPCIRSFPDTKILQSEYKDKGIQVIYLSVDQNHKFWDQVIQKYGLTFSDRSFIVMNLGKSEFLKVLDVSLIPRYILFDSNGKLIHPNAPRPESKEIRVLLDSLLS
jgi:thiol-disulfide isomerase/thioredoxin